MNNITFRPAGLDDLPILLEFEQGIVTAERPMTSTLKPGPITYYDIKALIEANDSEVVVAVAGNEVIGSGYAKIELSKPYYINSHFAYLGFMFVKNEYRGKGINHQLTEVLLKWAKSKNLREVSLEVYDQNDSAIRAYEKIGFTKNLVEMRMKIP